MPKKTRGPGVSSRKRAASPVEKTEEPGNSADAGEQAIFLIMNKHNGFK